MPDKEVIQAVLDAVGVTRGNRESKRCNQVESDCSAPDNVIYVILCNCVTINNGACEDGEFCGSSRPC